MAVDLRAMLDPRLKRLIWRFIEYVGTGMMLLDPEIIIRANGISSKIKCYEPDANEIFRMGVTIWTVSRINRHGCNNAPGINTSRPKVFIR